ncbi:type II CAAX prenyl endopeptidase Rce1 family protein [Calothrix sp. PCC 7507]|uniref:CPBP family glutamic-type intramembrane protease n=1 Tax=Calothrix sp. PCC 7507 TaxID=99598 RepID=UPI00029F0C00|nr:CPBP family glutamic-type intramembrane protease [Calothrix sp. PCC 7507]AFY34653.1 Abortive infection protein [Calothrix sp. PCC 7507]
MTRKQLGLILLTLISLGLAGLSLLGSWQEPQFQSRLELYQTNIALQAQAWQADDNNNENFQVIQSAILGENPLENATKQYEQARTSVLANSAKVKSQLVQLRSQSVPTPTPPKPLPETQPTNDDNDSSLLKQQKLEQSLNQLQKLLAELDLRLGILQTQQGKTDIALKTWADLQQRTDINPDFSETAAVLTGLWSNPPRLLPNSQQLIQKNLEGWFRSSALVQLYQLQQRQESLSALKVAEQEAAGQAVLKLAAIAIIPTFSALTGMILLIVLLGQRLIKGKAALLAQNGDVPWSTPWDGEIVLQVFVVGFFLMGQLFIPLLFSLLPVQLPSGDVRLQAFSVLIRYVLVASAALLVLYVSIKRFFPLPDSWFSFSFQNKWFLWGLGGYCAALPIVVLVSLINQQLWQGRGGSNPLLQQALESQDSVALGIFYLTAAIAAPFFEEVLFRGFLLPSLTRYLPVWGAILASSLLFALAHLSLSEILPLTALGIVLGVVYTRSRSLLAPMLLHSLWNSGTLLSLFILGSSN